MKKIILITKILILLVSASCAKETIEDDPNVETITYTIDGRTKNVRAVFLGWQQTRVSIEGENSNTWVKMETVPRLKDGEWGEWGLQNEVPYPFATSQTLNDLVALIIENEYQEDAINNYRTLLVITRNERNQDYWWEDRKYIHFLQSVFMIVD